MLDPVWKHLVTASYGWYGQRAARIGLDHVCLIQLPTSDLVPFFSKEGIDHIVQNQPGSTLDGLVRVWPNASGLEASRCAGIIRPGVWQDATSPLPVSLLWDLVGFFHRQPGSYCAELAWIQVSSGWLCQVLAKQIRSRSKLVWRNHPAHFWPMLLSWSRLDPACLLCLKKQKQKNTGRQNSVYISSMFAC